ncbi:MAG: hypothetical protein GXY38_11145 [Planctomycetes bacterium]|nr:hypothetical protein [Planctomycetota bacterium]
MKFKCDKCGKPASIYLTEIENGQKIQKHLCEECAAADGITIKPNVPISQLLEDFILHSARGQHLADLKCDICGLTFKEFRQQGLLGCPNDYDAFAPALEPLMQRAQERATAHVGKMPKGADDQQAKHNTILRLRAQLNAAVREEDYEQAAMLRDKIKEMERS